MLKGEGVVGVVPSVLLGSQSRWIRYLKTAASHRLSAMFLLKGRVWNFCALVLTGCLFVARGAAAVAVAV